MGKVTVESKNNFVLIRRDESETKQGSIIIPEKARQKTNRGTVISVGRGKRITEEGELTESFVPCEVKPGDRIVFDFYAVHSVKLCVDPKRGEEDLVFLPYYNVLAKIVEE